MAASLGQNEFCFQNTRKPLCFPLIVAIGSCNSFGSKDTALTVLFVKKGKSEKSIESARIYDFSALNLHPGSIHFTLGYLIL